MTLPLTTLESLRETARKATPGPWSTDDGCRATKGIGGHVYFGRELIAGCRGHHGPDTELEQQDANARHIAAFDPTTAIALLDELIALRKLVPASVVRRVTYEQEAARDQG